MKALIFKRKQIKTDTLILLCCFLVFSCINEKETQRNYPRVVTGLVTNINSEGATFNGSFLQAGESEIIDHGFVFSSFSYPDIYDEKISLGASNGRGTFTSKANVGFIKGRSYFVSAYAQNKDKIFYAEVVSFVSLGSASPEILNVVPSEGVKGDTVVIKGKYFSSIRHNNSVFFGNASAIVITALNSELTVIVPTSNDNEYVDVFVTVLEKKAQKNNGFRYITPI